MDSSSEDESSFIKALDDREVLKRENQCLGISRNYVPRWTARDGFREFFQNWVDGMTESHQTTRDTIKYEVQNSEDERTITARHPISKQLLGYIRFSKKQGELEITNFKAQLSRNCLELGVSSKRSGKDLAGTHGEGFKVASLVMLRNGYHVRYESANFFWRFDLGGREKQHLYCRLTPMARSKLEALYKTETRRIDRNEPRKLKGNIWEDVTVRIGMVRGLKADTGTRIHFDTFLDWTKISFDLNRPFGTIKTAYGDLVLNRDLKGRIYLKGLYLQNDSSTGANVKFCYNLASGQVNRDREMLTNPSEEASVFAKIWQEAILNKPETALTEYLNMLMEDQKEWAEVRGSEDYITRETAELLWKHLVKQDSKKEFFCYHKKTADKDVRMIENQLHKRPKPVPSCLWKPLKMFGFVRSPEEQQKHLLYTAPLSEERSAPYSNGFNRALKCALALDASTKDMEVVFKNGSTTDLEFYIHENTLLINDKFLDFQKGHQKGSCRLFRYCASKDIPMNHFECYHLLIILYRKIFQMSMIKAGANQNTDAAKLELLCQKVDDNLRLMPMLVEAVPGEKVGEIEVTWKSMYTRASWNAQEEIAQYSITLHAESTCGHRREDFICKSTTNDMPTCKDKDEKLPTSQECNCQHQIVSTFKCIFYGLTLNEKYFPIVTEIDPQGFIGLSPPSTQPRSPGSQNASRTQTSSQQSNNQTNDSTAELSRMRIRVQEYQAETNKQRTRLAEFAIEKDTLKKEIDTLKAQVSSTTQTCNNTNSGGFGTTLSGSISNTSPSQPTSRELDLLRQQQQQNDIKLEELTTLITQLDNDLTSTTAELNAANELISQLRERDQEQSFEAEPGPPNHENQLANLRSQLLIANEKIATLKSKNKKLEREKDELSVQLENAEEAYDIQIKLANDTATRRKRVQISPNIPNARELKREIGEIPDTGFSASKRRRRGVQREVEGVEIDD